MLKMSTALQKGKPGKVLGEEIVREALAGLGGATPAFALIFVTSHTELEAFAASAGKALGTTPWIACTTAGEFTEKEVQTNSAAIALFSKSEDYDFHVSIATGLHADAAGCLQKAVDAIPKPVDALPYRSAILLHDGLAGRGEEAVLSATSILGPEVFFAGGAAADDLEFKKTHVICNGRITTDSVALCVIDSRRPVGIGVKHGHAPVSKPLTLTKVRENVVLEVNGKPAWEVWTAEMAREARKEGIDTTQLTDASAVGRFLLRYELGLSTGRDYKIRIPLSKNEDGSLNFACTIPENAKFRIMKSPKKHQILSAEQAAKNAKKSLGRDKIAGALVFDCACRGLILGEDFYRGVEAVKKVVGQVPLIGFETYGEICRRPGQLSGLHNTTTVVMLLPA